VDLIAARMVAFPTALGWTRSWPDTPTRVKLKAREKDGVAGFVMDKSLSLSGGNMRRRASNRAQ